MNLPDFEALLRWVPCARCQRSRAEHPILELHTAGQFCRTFEEDFPAMAQAVRKAVEKEIENASNSNFILLCKAHKDRDERLLPRIGALEDACRDLARALGLHANGCDLCKKMLSRWATMIRTSQTAPSDPVASLWLAADDPVVQERDKIADERDALRTERDRLAQEVAGRSRAIDALKAEVERLRGELVLSHPNVRGHEGWELCNVCAALGPPPTGAGG